MQGLLKKLRGQHERKVSREENILSTSYRGGMVQVESSRIPGAVSPNPSWIGSLSLFTTKKVGHGTGLGLSISYSIVQDYEGTIKVETHENAGSKFTVQFPVAAED